jgi:hypothetical protein
MPRRKLNRKGKGVLSSINNFLKKWKPISTIASLASLIPDSRVKIVSGAVGGIAGALGYGKKKGRGEILTTDYGYGRGRVKKRMSQREKMKYVRSFL